MRAITILISLVLGHVAVAQPCIRDPLLPSALPAVGCPTRVMPAPCHWCPKGDERLALHYAGTPLATATDWATALRAAGWKVDHTKLSLRATKGQSRVWMVVATLHGTTVVTLNYTP